MTLVSLKDILITARQESHRMRHFFLGVEHLFVALLEIKGGLTSSIVTEQGVTPEYVIDAIRRKAGKGSRHVLWAGIPNTPRTDVVLDIAQELAKEDSRQHIQERDILIAILDEAESIPMRVLKALGLDIHIIREEAETRQIKRSSTQPFLRVDFAPDFDGVVDNEQLFVLRRMFYGYGSIRVEARLTGGYTSADVLVVTPVNVDGREDATVVVKIGSTDNILDEAQRYEKFVKATLPPLTARLEDRPVSPETSDLAGLKYTFITDSQRQPKDVRTVLRDWSGQRIGEWFQKYLYQNFGEKWWQQSKPYRFEAWQEYDWLLPPIFTLQILRDESIPDHAQVLRFPIRHSRISELDYGDAIIIENFIVQRVEHDHSTIRLGLGQGTHTNRPYQIEVRGIDFDRDTYYRGEVVERLGGTIWRTRDEQLMMAARSLEPDFDLQSARIDLGGNKYPNPIKAYQNLLDLPVEGRLSIIHGDLHLGNILIGPNDSLFLIDFGRTRDGHTIFDWANLEVSVWSELITPLIGTEWADVMGVTQHFATQAEEYNKDNKLEDALEAVRALRDVAGKCLARSDKWQEYYLSLAFASLRAITWTTMPLQSRRVMFCLSAWAMSMVFENQKSGVSKNTPSPDTTDFFTNDD